MIVVLPLTVYFHTMTKRYEMVGIGGVLYPTAQDAASHTYMKQDGSLPSTPLIFPDNPFNDQIKNDKHILDLGCGIGRNLSWIMENTSADYTGLEPNASMRQFYWDIQDEKYKSRTNIVSHYNQIPDNVKFDVVVCTFVFQHIGRMTADDQMNVIDITNEVVKYCNPGCVWIMYEHDWEDMWIEEWAAECNVNFAVYKRDYAGIPELVDRRPHHLMIWQND